MTAYGPADLARWVAEDPSERPGARDDFARDRARIVHSAGLRRLAAKTQVMRPTTDDFIRNRLTHSLEVAQIGREFGAALGCHPDLVDTACLAHDLGHPPFGHNGERMLQELTDHIGGFEGNAQTFRLLTRLEAKRFHLDGRPAGLNLTRASLDAAMKYPWAREPGRAKFGVYDDDRAAFDFVRVGAADGPCLEAQVMDWSDDVAYCVHDVEDAVASGRLDLRLIRDPGSLREVGELARTWYDATVSDDELVEAGARLVEAGRVPRSYDGSLRDLAGLKDMTSRLIGHLLAGVEEATRAQWGPGPLQRYAAQLVVPKQLRSEVTLLKALAAHHVMLSAERLVLQESEREVVVGLVELYLERPDLLDAELAEAREAATTDDDLLRVVVDQVASLSDARALAVHAHHYH